MSSSPIVIGALGGSGTRVFAQILQACNIYIGNELNGPLDNITFSRLFRIPEIYTVSPGKSSRKRLKVFAKYMKNEFLNPKDLAVFLNANAKNGSYKNSFGYTFNLLRSKPNSEYWGWKAPVSHLYIPHLVEYFPDMKFIQVIRNGFDMAFSENLNQLKIWGQLFGLDYKADDMNLPSKQLEYWYRSNKQAIEQGRDLLGKNFKVIKFEEFCREPETLVPELLAFLDVKVKQKTYESLLSLPRLPKTYNRHVTHNYSFTDVEKGYVNEINSLIQSL